MHSEVTTMSDKADATVLLGGSTTETTETTGLTGYYDVKCLDSAGNVKWEETIKNLVTTVGKNDILDKYFSGSAYTAYWYMGLVDGGGTAPSYNVTNTLSSHTGWTEFTGYTVYPTRPSTTFAAATGGSKASTAVTYTINAAGTVAGAFLASTTDNSGILYSAGDFTGSSRVVAVNDTLLVTYTAVAA